MCKEWFQFKKFRLTHASSSMKIGVDAVLLGAWAEIEGCKVLEVGTGCGVISMMLAQRFPDINITAIDIDLPSIDEAKRNFFNSPFKDRIKAFHTSFESLIDYKNNQYDAIVSNPPYFDSGIEKPDSARLKARHQATLSPQNLMEGSSVILKEGGLLSFIIPYSVYEKLENVSSNNLQLRKRIKIRTKPNKDYSRVLLQYCKNDWRKPDFIKDNLLIDEELLLNEEDGQPSLKYRNMCKDFYLKF